MSSAIDTALVPAALSAKDWTLPSLIADAGELATGRFLEFFTVNIRNPHSYAAAMGITSPNGAR